MGKATGKPLVWLNGQIKTPPLGRSARIEAGFLLRLLQNGEVLSMPHSRPMPSVGNRCHELRITDEDTIWRFIYRIDPDAVVIGDVFCKKSAKTPRFVIENCTLRFRRYDEVARG